MKEKWEHPHWRCLIERANTTAARQWYKVVPHLEIQPKIFLDIGVGEWGSEAWQVRKTNPDCIIIGFEPQPHRFQLLKHHNYPGILLPFVINNKSAVIKGYMGHPHGQSDFCMYGKNQPHDAYKKVKIDSYTLDSLEEDYGPFDDAFIWADVEGSELNVLQGAQRLFDENKIIGANIEVRKIPLGHGACVENQIIEFLETNRFHQIPHNNTTNFYDIIFVPNSQNKGI